MGVIIVGSTWLLISSRNKRTRSYKLQITASFYPYYFFASKIGGDKTDVINITPSGGEPHDYEPTSQDIVNIQASKLLILNGTVEPWANKVKDTLKDKKTVILEVGGELFTQDPHVWLSPTLAKKQVNTILNEFIQIDPVNENYYYINANKLLGELDGLDNEFKNGLSSCKQKNIVTSHAAFAYLASDYGFNQVTITGVSPDEEPSLKKLGQLADFVRKNNIKYIFFESLVSPKLAETVAYETGAKTLVLNPIEGLTPEEVELGKNYLTIMRDNLQNLKVALECP